MLELGNGASTPPVTPLTVPAELGDDGTVQCALGRG